MSDNNEKIDEPKDYKRIKENTQIIICFAFITAFFAISFISLFIYYNLENISVLQNAMELRFVLIVILIRICIIFPFSMYMFKKWYSQGKRYLKNITFLVGLFFYFATMGKFLDMILYIYYTSPNLNEERILFLTKIRYFILLITYLPMLFLGLRPVIYNFGLKHNWDEKKVLKIRKAIIALYLLVFGFLIAIAPSIAFITLILAIMSILTYISIWYIFRFAHKNNTFPTIRANIVAWGFLIYLLFSPLRLILISLFPQYFTLARAYLIGEIFDAITMCIIIIGFLLKSK